MEPLVVSHSFPSFTHFFRFLTANAKRRNSKNNCFDRKQPPPRSASQAPHLFWFCIHVYLQKWKIYAWKPLAEKDSNFTNKVRLQGANVSHMVFLSNTLAIGTLLLLFHGFFLLNSSYGFFLWEGLASFFIAACKKKKWINKIVIRIEGICRGLLISGICSSGECLNWMPHCGDAMSPPGGPDGVSCCTFFCFTLLLQHYFAWAQTTEFTWVSV